MKRSCIDGHCTIIRRRTKHGLVTAVDSSHCWFVSEPLTSLSLLPNMSDFPRLFSSTTLGATRIANRIVMAPMTRSRALPNGSPHALNAEYFAQRASAGLLITDATAVSVQGTGYPMIYGMYTEEQATGWKLVVDAVHAAGGKIALQLFHVGRLVLPDYQPDEAQPVSSSAVIAPTMQMMSPQFAMKPVVLPRALEEREIPGIVAQFTHAATLAKTVGFDAVELHGANGYLIDQFLRDGVNKRGDKYGGTPEKRARFLLEVTEAVAKVMGADRTAVRLSPTGAIHDMSDSTPRSTFAAVAKALAPLGLAYLHVAEKMGGEYTQELADLTHAMRDAYDKPLMLNGGYTAERAEEAIKSDIANSISFGAVFIANPDLPARLATGAELATPDPRTFYGGAEQGYTDYPTMAGAVG
jgi:N-ethylmaleimide reductase